MHMNGNEQHQKCPQKCSNKYKTSVTASYKTKMESYTKIWHCSAEICDYKKQISPNMLESANPGQESSPVSFILKFSFPCISGIATASILLF